MPDTPVVLVTGSARRIGARIIREFHACGFDTLIHFNSSADSAKQLAAELNSARANSARILQADLTRPDDMERLAAHALATFGRLDVLVNNASAFYPTPMGDVTQQQWDELVDSNLRGAFFLSQGLALELRARRGAIVNVLDTHAERPLTRHPVYSIAKAGLKAMTRSLAIELAPQVRVNGVSPGAILWPTQLENSSDPDVLRRRQKVLDGIPLGQIGDPGDIARTVCFLACEAHYMTGAVIKVDGGRSLA